MKFKQWIGLAATTVVLLGSLTGGLAFYTRVVVRAETQAIAAELRGRMDDQDALWDEQRRAMREDLDGQMTRLIDTVVALVSN